MKENGIKIRNYTDNCFEAHELVIVFAVNYLQLYRSKQDVKYCSKYQKFGHEDVK